MLAWQGFAEDARKRYVELLSLDLSELLLKKRSGGADICRLCCNESAASCTPAGEGELIKPPWSRQIKATSKVDPSNTCPLMKGLLSSQLELFTSEKYFIELTHIVLGLIEKRDSYLDLFMSLRPFNVINRTF